MQLYYIFIVCNFAIAGMIAEGNWKKGLREVLPRHRTAAFPMGNLRK